MTPPWKSPACVCRWLPSSGEDFCDICGEPLRDCLVSSGRCHFDTGEWGAWRAFLAVADEAAVHAHEMGNLKRIARAINACVAAGWSP